MLATPKLISWSGERFEFHHGIRQDAPSNSSSNSIYSQYFSLNSKSSSDGQTCETKFVRSKIPWWNSKRSPDQLINLGVASIIFRYLCGHISTFCPANTVKTECALHWTAERESIGLALWVQREILWVYAIFVCKFDSFLRSVLSPNWLQFPNMSLIITP